MLTYESEAIIYLASSYDDTYNKFITENYSFIFNRLEKEAGITFIHLPKLLLDSDFQKLISYKYPYLGDNINVDLVELTEIIKKKYDISKERSAFVYISEMEDDGFSIELDSSTSKVTRENLEKLTDEILKKIQWIRNKYEILEVEDSDLRFKMGDDSLSSLFFEEEVKEYFGNDADENFNKVAFVIPEDLRKKINDIKEAGHLSILIEFLEELQKATRKLSRLKITQDYNIYLMDYNMREVKLSPLPKALYLLFLKHPEGIIFKELPSYMAELMNIYKNITLRECPDKTRESIIRMTDPFDNSVNEKCSMIRNAFLKIISDDIAENYYITGYRGEPKKITLDRELVINEL